MQSAVLDTNVLVSGLLKRRRGGIPDQILRQISKFRLCLSEDILKETNRVLHYPRIQRKFQLTKEVIQEYLTYLRSIAVWVENIPPLEVIKEDPTDNAVLACAVHAQVDYIVSGDAHLKKLKNYQGIQIIAPAEFLQLLTRNG
ncbi:putative toxin-antitoxin system toxin component, PIN family [Candidatus Acetothermia bacterium]|nr:putative toxin-antitoxin system toxin component, PIN family [Candidatus Acetothermia bacterium]